MLIKMDLISVILPVYNSEKYISKSIKSILNQTHKNFEFIIINDNSTDKSEKIILKYKDPRIKYIKNKINIGEQKSTNLGLKIAKGKYIAIMHSDDISHNERLEKEFNYLNENKNIFLIGTKFRIINKNNKVVKIPNIKQIKHNQIKKNLINGKNQICHPSIMFRNEKKIRYRSKISYCPDLDLYFQLLSKNKKINIIDNILIDYRIHENQISSSKKYKQYLFKKNTLDIYKGLIKYSEFNPNKILNLNESMLKNKDKIIYYHL